MQYNLPCRHVLYAYRVVMHYKTTKFYDIPSPLPEQNSPIQETNCSCKVRQSSHVTTYPQNGKLKWDYYVIVFQFTTYPKNRKLKWEYYVIIFAIHLTKAFFSDLLFPWLHIFLHRASFFPSSFYLVSCAFGCEARCSALCWNPCFWL